MKIMKKFPFFIVFVLHFLLSRSRSCGVRMGCFFTDRKITLSFSYFGSWTTFIIIFKCWHIKCSYQNQVESCTDRMGCFFTDQRNTLSFMYFGSWTTFIIIFDAFQFNLRKRTHYSMIVPPFETLVGCSVTRFGKILPLSQTFKRLWQNINALYSIWQNVEPTLAVFMLLGKFSLLKIAKYWTNNLAIWSHWLVG